MIQKHTPTLSKVAQEDVCPQCGATGDRFEYDGQEFADDKQFYYECTCRDCGLEFNQWYLSTFDGHIVGEVDIRPKPTEWDELKEINKKLLAACKWMRRELCEAWDESPEKAIPAEHRNAIVKAEKEE